MLPCDRDPAVLELPVPFWAGTMFLLTKMGALKATLFTQAFEARPRAPPCPPLYTLLASTVPVYPCTRAASFPYFGHEYQ